MADDTKPGSPPQSVLEGVLGASWNTIIVALAVASAVLVIANVVTHKHGYFDAIDIPGFYGIAAAVTVVICIVAGGALRKALGARETIYDE